MCKTEEYHRLETYISRTEVWGLTHQLEYRKVPIFASLAQQVEREICNFDVVGSIPTGGSKFLIMSIFASYYVICVIYCLYQLFKNLSKRYSDDPTGASPELDTIMVVMMAWVLAPIDVSLTWIRWYKDAEIARRKHTKFF